MSASRAHADTRIEGWAQATWPLRSSNNDSATSLAYSNSNSAASSPFAVPMSMGNADSPPTTPPDSSNLRLLPSVHAAVSRNDIFSVAKPQPMPAPRLALSINSTATTTTTTTSGSSPSSSSKNSIFFGSSPLSAQVRSPIIAASLTPVRPVTLDVPSAARPHSNSLDRPSYGRSSTEERERERARIRQSRDQVDFRLCPSKEFLLGEGRHCNVYLGSYRLKPRPRKQKVTQGTSNCELDQVDEQERTTWQLCAIKRLHADRQSQLLGLDEAFALRRLGPHPHVVTLIDIRDEVQLSTSAHSPGAGSGVTADLGMGRPSSLVPPPHPCSSHGRSASESTHSHAQLHSRSPERTDEGGLHRRLASQPLGVASLDVDTPVVRIARPEEEGEGWSFARTRTPSPPEGSNATLLVSPLPTPTVSPAPSGSSSSSSNDPPRLLILLELLPHSLSTFAKRNAERVDWPTWRTWALQIAETIEWMHGKGCVHADIKKENILLTDSLDVKLCDFNSAVFPSANAPLLDGAGLGTPAYGAPELTRTAGASPGFSFPCDVWSCGAVMYSLATGVEPFERARSMIDILYRKRIFFESEENDRIARLSVAEGYVGGSNAGSTSASRNGSLRGRNARATRPNMRREGSVDSIESVASSIRVAGGNASLRDIAMLLDAAPPTGLLVPPVQQEDDGSEALQHPFTLNGHQRAASLGKSSHLNPSRCITHSTSTKSAATLGGTYTPVGTSGARLGTRSRPPVLRRTTSYGGDLNGDESPAMHPRASTPAVSPPKPNFINAPSSPRSPRASNAGLRLAVSAALAQASRRAAQELTHEHSPFGSPLSAQARELHRTSGASGDYTASLGFANPPDDEEEETDLRPYRDGSPALILPGGGRLPDAARALLERMLSTDPSLRPTAGQVVTALRNL